MNGWAVVCVLLLVVATLAYCDYEFEIVSQLFYMLLPSLVWQCYISYYLIDLSTVEFLRVWNRMYVYNNREHRTHLNATEPTVRGVLSAAINGPDVTTT